MRIPTAILLKARSPQQENAVPFQEILPLRLKNTVSGKSDSASDVQCLQEMAVLFACLKDNDFVESSCSKQIGNFQNCYKLHLDKSFAAKRNDNEGIVMPGKKLNYKQLNKYMRRYPNPL